MYKDRQKERAYQREYQKKWRAKNPNKARSKNLRYNFGISTKQYETLLLSQRGVCAICQQPETARAKNGKVKRLAVDHDHKTGRIRGLLCNNCNIGIGAFGDNDEHMRSAVAYIQERNPQLVAGWEPCGSCTVCGDTIWYKPDSATHDRPPEVRRSCMCVPMAVFALQNGEHFHMHRDA